MGQMAEDNDRPKPPQTHRVGEPLDTLSIHEFDERIALLKSEIDRLETAKHRKLTALDQAGSVFRS
jgi:uncharacterized small protein (DUF1192 family)